MNKLDRWLETDALWLMVGMSWAAVYGAIQPLEPWTKGSTVAIWALMGIAALLLVTYRELVL